MNRREKTTVNAKKTNWKCLLAKDRLEISELPQTKRSAKKVTDCISSSLVEN